jgi:hypothetical protein
MQATAGWHGEKPRRPRRGRRAPLAGAPLARIKMSGVSWCLGLGSVGRIVVGEGRETISRRRAGARVFESAADSSGLDVAHSRSPRHAETVWNLGVNRDRTGLRRRGWNGRGDLGLRDEGAGHRGDQNREKGHRPVVHPQVLDGLMRTRRGVSLVQAGTTVGQLKATAQAGLW